MEICDLPFMTTIKRTYQTNDSAVLSYIIWIFRKYNGLYKTEPNYLHEQSTLNALNRIWSGRVASAFNQHVMFAAVQHGFNTANYTLLNFKKETNAIELFLS